ncbi:MAG: hypothetical protein HOI95_10410 [Chromatiales bacterium]|nr:hypothetical protein [Chromatiales bacterium]
MSTMTWICLLQAGSFSHSEAVSSAATTTALAEAVLVLLVPVQLSSFAYVGARTTGADTEAEPRRRGTSLALYSNVPRSEFFAQRPCTRFVGY